MTGVEQPRLNCPSCGFVAAGAEAFCVQCGSRLGGPQPPAQAVAAAAPAPAPAPPTGAAAPADPPSPAGPDPLALVRARIAGIPLRAKLGIAGVAALVVLVLAGSAILSAPEPKIEAALDTILARNPSTDLLGAADLGGQLRIAYAPADVVFTTKSRKVEKAPGSVPAYRVAWTIEARRGTTVLETRSVQLTVGIAPKDSGAAFIWNAAQGIAGFDLKQLVLPAQSTAEAQSMVDAANQANAKFEVGEVQLVKTTPDVPGGAPDPTRVPDNSLLETCPERLESPSEAALQDIVDYVAPDGSSVNVGTFLVKHEVVGKVIYGALTEKQLLAEADGAIAAFATAVSAGDVESALKVLTNADGLAKAGLAASTLGKERAVSLETVDCADPKYSARTDADPLRLVERDDEGAWRIDYTGQPLDVMQASERTKYGSQVLVTGGPLILEAGTSALRPVISVRLSGGAYACPGGLCWHYNIVLDSLEVDGVAVPVKDYSNVLCPRIQADGTTECPWGEGARYGFDPPPAQPDVPIASLSTVSSVKIQFHVVRAFDNEYMWADPEYPVETLRRGELTWVRQADASSPTAPAP